MSKYLPKRRDFFVPKPRMFSQNREDLGWDRCSYYWKTPSWQGIPLDFPVLRWHPTETVLQMLLKYIYIYIPWKSNHNLFIGWLPNHHYFSEGLSSPKRNHHLLNGGWLPGHTYLCTWQFCDCALFGDCEFTWPLQKWIVTSNDRGSKGHGFNHQVYIILYTLEVHHATIF